MPTKKSGVTLRDALRQLADATESDDGPEYVEQHDIVREGTAIILPDGMGYDEAIDNLRRRRDYEQQVTEFSETIDAFPWDAAAAMSRVLTRRYGWSHSIGNFVNGMFGKRRQPPLMVSIEVGVNQTMQVPWGRFELPGVDGWVETETDFDGNPHSGGRAVFKLSAQVLRKHEDEIKILADEIRQEVIENSLYRGKAIRVSFSQDDPFKAPKFMDVSGVTADSLVYSEHVKSSILTNLITPIENTSLLRKYGVPFKRGVLLAGVFGTGKTLAALHAANRAMANGITFVYVEKADEFASAVRFVRNRYEPAVVFCEDIDRVTSGDRTANLDSILNIVDGIDSKTTEIMVVLTTNNVDAISQGMLRPGRLDAVIEVEPPDAGAVRNLITLYGRGLLSKDANLERVGEILQGQIPAVVREVVERAKLAAIRLGNVTQDGLLVLSDEALVDSANTMRMQIGLLNRKPHLSPTELEKFGNAFGKSAGAGLAALAETLASGDATYVVGIGSDQGSGVRRILDAPVAHSNYVSESHKLGALPVGTLDAVSDATS